MNLRLAGEWELARRLLANASTQLTTAVNKALRQEAHALRNDVVQGLTRQAPGGEPIRPLAPLTLASRRLEGFRGTKALLESGELRNSIAVIERAGEVFIGVLRTARSREGQSLVSLAELHELGGPPVVIPLTPKMRRYLAVLVRQAGAASGAGGGGARGGAGVVVVQTPARPFLRPAFERFRKHASRRFLERVAAHLWPKSQR